ncbi:uncharacterized protein LOC120465414 isoform X1 [Pimephales promelas]|uniref:uncharacterized protein LOC120465414 isoform X1 n=1 Tax=Pimephales promelas TaxID=90988 RepID=UPI001955DD0F|nr:uncharacterized protein LOC120465414 isoform X1 [Pimephales promelas]
MMLIFGLMLLLLKIAASVERFCWFNQSGPCNVVLGDKLSLMMTLDASKNDLRIHKRIYNTSDDPFCKIKNDRINEEECDLFKNTLDEVSVNNGILVINPVIRADSGIYRLQVFNSQGVEILKADLQVIVEDVKFTCSFDQSVPCSVALGDELRLKLADPSKNDLRIHKRIYNTPEDPVCRIKNDRINEEECDLFKNRPVSVSNGILVINAVVGADSGIYSLQVFKSTGKEIFNADLQVIVEVSVLCSEGPSSLVHVLVWSFQMVVLLGLLGGFHVYMRLTSGKKEEDQSVRMRRFREGHEDTAEDGRDQQQISSHQ